MKYLDKNITIAGYLNPKLLEPEWVMDNNIIKRMDFNKILDLESRFLIYEFEELGIQWKADYNKLVVSPINIASEFKADNLEFIYKIFEILEHTPLIAVGYNVHIVMDKDVLNLFNLKKNDFLKKLNIENNSDYISEMVHHKYKWKDLLLSLRVEKKETDYQIVINFEKSIARTDKVSSMVGKFINRIPEFEGYVKELIGG